MQFSSLLQSTLVALSLMTLVQADSSSLPPYCQTCTSETNCTPPTDDKYKQATKATSVETGYDHTFKYSGDSVWISTSDSSPAILLDNQETSDAIVRFSYSTTTPKSLKQKTVFVVPDSTQCVIPSSPPGFINRDITKMEVFVNKE